MSRVRRVAERISPFRAKARFLPVNVTMLLFTNGDISRLSGSWSSGMTSPLHGGGRRFESGRAH